MRQSLLCFLAFADKFLLYISIIIAFLLSVVFMPFKGFAFQPIREETFIVIPIVVSGYVLGTS
ncbi:hypothetical protein OUZ56_030047 [Daphnia magna]|uniref:ABC transporter permease n=1 Tax=Daphnia magna TaxID=35525 RepID=A0ABQ9ZQ57_9CRUS|nr:hypothetical protein OUZ56_030047 [Daphnia magna]